MLLKTAGYPVAKAFLNSMGTACFLDGRRLGASRSDALMVATGFIPWIRWQQSISSRNDDGTRSRLFCLKRPPATRAASKSKPGDKTARLPSFLRSAKGRFGKHQECPDAAGFHGHVALHLHGRS